MKQTGKVALGGIMASLSLVFMFLTIFPYATYALPAIAGAVLIPVVIELGAKWGWLVYAAVALLSLFIVPTVEPKMMFIAFFGYYPVLKSSLERIRLRSVEWIIKFAVFNAAMIAAYFLMMTVMGLDSIDMELFGVDVPWIFLGIGNVVFLIYDLALTNVISAYVKILHPKLVKIFR